MAARRLIPVCVIVVIVSAACAAVISPNAPSTRSGAPPVPAAKATSSHAGVLRRCSLVTQQSAAAISGDAAVANRASNVLEPGYGYVACIYTDADREGNSVSVQIKRIPMGSSASALRQAAAFFEGGEPSQPYSRFLVAGVGANALGESIPGVAFVVFATEGGLVSVRASSTFVSAPALRSGVADLAVGAAAALESAIGNQP